ncbi:MAG: hypothetical protein QM743_10235 [Chitinophagaceae bacterium]
MKKAYILNIFSSLVCMGILPNVSAQTEHQINIDFTAKTVQTQQNGKLKQGDFVKVNVLHLNQQQYKVSINKSDTSFYSDVVFPKLADIDMAGIADMLAKIPALSTTVSVTAPQPESISNAFTESYTKSNTKIKRPPASPFPGRLNAVLAALAGIYTSMMRDKIAIDQLNFEIEKYLLEQYDMQATGAPTFSAAVISPAGIEARIDVVRASVVANMIQISTERDHLVTISASSGFTEWLGQSDENKNFYQGIQALVTTMDTTEANVFLQVNAVNAAALLKRVLKLANNASTTFTSLPMMINGDATELDIAIVPKDSSWSLPAFTMPKLRFPSTPRWYVGGGSSFIYSSLHNEAYSTIETQVDSVKKNYKLKKEGGLSGELAIAALLHFGKKIAHTDWGCNLVIGPALSLTTVVRPRLTTGIGFSYGSRQMLSANLMLVAGYESRLSTVYEANKDYDVKPETPVVSRLGLGWGIALGYIYKF